MRITYLVVKNFAKWMKAVTPPDVSFDVIGANPDNLKSVEKLLREYCLDLSYDECKRLYVEQLLHGRRVKTEEDIEAEAVTNAERSMSYYNGTTSVSEAFKRIYDKYGEVIYKVNLDPEEINNYPELSVLYDYVSLKFKCSDIEIARVNDLMRFSEKVDYYEGDPIDAYRDYKQGFNLKDARSFDDLTGMAGEVGIVYPRDYKDKIMFLVCHRGYEEEIKYVVLTHNVRDNPIIEIKFSETLEPRFIETQKKQLKERLDRLRRRYNELLQKEKTLSEKELEELDKLEKQISMINLRLIELETAKHVTKKTRTGFIALVY